MYVEKDRKELLYILDMSDEDNILVRIFLKVGMDKDRATLLAENLVLTSHVETCSNLAKAKNIELEKVFPTMMASTPEEIYKFMTDNWDSTEVDDELKRVGEELGFLVMQKVMQEKNIKNQTKVNG